MTLSNGKKQDDAFSLPTFVTGSVNISSNLLSEWQQACRDKKWMNKRACPGECYEPTHFEHFANTFTHGIMIVPSILAGELLLQSAYLRHLHIGSFDHNQTHLSEKYVSHSLHYEVSARIYGASLVGLFVVSSIFHWLTWSKCEHPTKTIRLSDNCCGSALWEFFHLCDRAIIFTFISGSYTPWLMLSSIHPSLEWLRWGMWLFVLLGILYSCLLLEKYKLLETILYVAQGLLPALALSTTAEGEHLQALSVGGFFYLSGVIVFKSDGWIPCAHAIWHMFVAAGAVSHFFTCYNMLYYLP
ncbi:monocyte to macrophage differentiation factor-like [Styela clava]